MPVFCRLLDPHRYRVSDWNLALDEPVKRYWLDLFASFPGRMEGHLREDKQVPADFERRWSAFRAEYDAGMRAIRAETDRGGELHTIDLCRFRQRLLNRFGFDDPYAGVKQRENELAAGLYPRVIARIDAMPPTARWPLLLRGLLAGNLFDLGCPETIEMYHRGRVGFFDTLDRLPDRPWHIDQTGAVIERLDGDAWRQVLIFVDNAGADIALGVIPLAREMARRGRQVVLAANTGPALNDITLAELTPLLARLAAADAVLAEAMADRRLRAVESGGDTPLLDLGRVSEACNAAATGCDLIVLEGMGRGVESNWIERFDCDAWRVALLKDRTVADRVGGRMFAGICRFDRADRGAA